jgi:hypothetical protein
MTLCDPVTSLITGQRQPSHTDDFDILAYIGGPRPRPWPQKWIECGLCKGDWPATAYPGPGGKWFWPSICLCCADRLQGTQTKPSAQESKAIRL